MSITQHPLTDEQIMGYHELPGSGEWFQDARHWFDAGREHERTATPAEPHHDPRPWQDCTRADIRKGDLVEALNGDRLIVGIAYRQDADGDWYTENGNVLTLDTAWPLRRIPAHTTEKETPMPENPTTAEPVNSQAVAPGPRERITNEIAEWLEIETREGGYSYLHMGCGHTMNLDPETRAALVAYLTMTEITTPAEPLARTLLAVPEGHGAPHHDASQIKPDDYVMQMDWDGKIRAGKAHHQDEDGDWMTKGSGLITFAFGRADRPDALTVWPASTPPAVEVEIPTEFGAVILNPRWGARSYTRAVHLGEGVWAAEVTPGAPIFTHLVRDLRSATLLDGTRVRRDGKYANGEPRFVKVDQ